MQIKTAKTDSGITTSIQFQVPIDAVQLYWLKKYCIDELTCTVDSSQRRLLVSAVTTLWD